MGLHDERTREHAANLMLAMITYLWGDKYGPDDVRKLARGVARHLQQPYTFVVVTDQPQAFEEDEGIQAVSISDRDRHLTQMKGCFVRLELFDAGFQLLPEFNNCERFACIDLDSVVTGPLDPLFNRPERFVILQGANASNPCPYNGSLWMVRRFAYQDVYADFTIEKAQKIKFYEFPDDQGWMHHKIPHAAGWHVGSRSGVYAFMKPGWPTVKVEDIGDGRAGKQTDELPGDARLVVFPGWRSPKAFDHLPWVKENWAA
jgi:hypothetical protein